MSEAIRDAVAAAIYESHGGVERGFSWQELPEGRRQGYRVEADAAIRALYAFSVESVAAYAESEEKHESLR